ncbi:hypothetical protein BJX76DRAFT_358728 [Aspergillus varians]
MVCKLGILNRVGLQKLPEIFHDYRTWETWDSKSQKNKTTRLAAFTPEILKRLKVLRHEWDGNTDRLREQVSTDKEKLLEALSQRTMKAAEKAKAYRELLCQYEMILRVVNKSGKWIPVEGRVRAVGVWDTVGSLGMPRMPFFHYQSSRSDDEARFASCEVDSNIDYAFHALALDEWRTAFGPTLWHLGEENDHTQLKQVWFPGSHRNIGGGWSDQQIETIALAWLADQLTSLGVEFSRPEMKRLFRWVNPEIEIREWGRGKIYDPKGLTTWPDKVYNLLPFTALPKRKPGMYMTDENPPRTLHRTMEFVHPSVRIRFLYQGKGPDDAEAWHCRALIENGYQLKKKQGPNMRRSNQQDCATAPLTTLLGDIIPYYESSGHCDVNPAVSYVKIHHPEKCELAEMGKHNGYWAWQTEDNQHELLEEYLGVWERMFIHINGELLRWQDIDRDRMALNPNTEFRPDYSYYDILTWLEGDESSDPLFPALSAKRNPDAQRENAAGSNLDYLTHEKEIPEKFC